MIPLRFLAASKLIRKPCMLGSSSSFHLSLVRHLKTGNDGSPGGKSSGHEPDVPPAVPRGGNADIFMRPGLQRRPDGPKTVEDFADPTGEDKNWVSYGCDPLDKTRDRYEMHYYACTTIVFLFIWGSLIYRYYRPDFAVTNLLCGPGVVISRDRYDFWAMREAYLQLERREKLGLPLVDPDYIPREKMLKQLPSEEELALYDYEPYV